MSLRLARVNELVKREIGIYLSTRYGSETVRWTITSVDVSADLRNATVAYSVIGDELDARKAQQFFKKHAGEIREWSVSILCLNTLPSYSLSEISGWNGAIG